MTLIETVEFIERREPPGSCNGRSLIVAFSAKESMIRSFGCWKFHNRGQLSGLRENLEHVSTGKDKIAGGDCCRHLSSAEPDRLIGLGLKCLIIKTNQITIGYRINEAYWHRGIATETVALLIAYLCDDIGIQTIKAFVMPENKYLERVLMNNGFY